MRIELSRTIPASIDRVFEVFADLDRAPDRVTGIISVERQDHGPVGQGTRWKETRKVFNREASEELEIVEFNPPRSYRVGCDSCGARYETEFRFSDQGTETRVDQTVVCRPVSLWAKLMFPLSKLMAGAMRKCMEQDLDELVAVLSQPAAADAAATAPSADPSSADESEFTGAAE